MSTESFSERLLADTRFLAPGPQRAAKELRYLAVKDQLLVDVDTGLKLLLPTLERRAKSEGWTLTRLTSLHAGLSGTLPTGDVAIYEVAGVPNIFVLVDELRKLLSKNDDFGMVSPNHILIPALEGHGCPWGPPHPVSGNPELPTPTREAVNVAVVDSGYQWDEAAWPPNPLGPYIASELAAERPPTAAEITAARNTGQPTPSWIKEAMDVPGETVPADPPGRLVALAGHANFVAGVIVQGCPNARITIFNHNGAFNPTSDDYPTEASVALSLARSASFAPSVINVGFAFAAYGGKISAVWKSAFDHLAHHVDPLPMVVAPAGNQDSAEPRYPAALGFANAIGVAAIDEVGTRATFSNHGGPATSDWVTCAAKGENIESTFLHVNMLLEDGDAERHSFDANSWAQWSGTSFAAPKVAAAIASRINQTNPDPGGAWHTLQNWAEEWDLQNAVAPNQPPHLGIVLRGL